MNKEEKQENVRTLLLPKNDIIFQALFGTKGNEKILAALLSNILDDKVENVSLNANQQLVRKYPNEKLGILDLVANVGKNIAVNIELQLIDQKNLEKRLLFYWAKRYGSQLESGEDYSNLKKTISILIADFEISELKSFKDAHTKWTMLEKRNITTQVFRDIELHIIEMPKVLKHRKTEKGLSTWVEFLLDPESERVKMSVKKDKNIKNAYEKLEDISGDEEMRMLAELRQKYILDKLSRENYANRQIEKAKEISKKAKEDSKKAKENSKKAKENSKKAKEIIKKAKEISKKAQMDIEKAQIDIKEAKEMKQEVEKEVKYIAKKLLERQMPINEIMEITGLDKETIEKLKDKSKQT